MTARSSIVSGETFWTATHERALGAAADTPSRPQVDAPQPAPPAPAAAPYHHADGAALYERLFGHLPIIVAEPHVFERRRRRPLP